MFLRSACSSTSRSPATTACGIRGRRTTARSRSLGDARAQRLHQPVVAGLLPRAIGAGVLVEARPHVLVDGDQHEAVRARVAPERAARRARHHVARRVGVSLAVRDPRHRRCVGDVRARASSRRKARRDVVGDRAHHFVAVGAHLATSDDRHGVRRADDGRARARRSRAAPSLDAEVEAESCRGATVGSGKFSDCRIPTRSRSTGSSRSCCSRCSPQLILIVDPAADVRSGSGARTST